MSGHIEKLIQRNRAQHQGSFLYEDAEWMRRAYVDRGLTLRAMAQEAGCGLRTIARWMQTHGIPTDRARIGQSNPSGEQHYNWQGGPPPCPQCGGPKHRAATTCQPCRDRSGSKNPKWLDDDTVTYEAAHFRILAARGRADSHPCARCHTRSAQQWAYDHTDPAEKRNSLEGHDYPFSLNVNRYLPLCVGCHKRFDADWRKTH